jgi:hypothetical protein
MGIVLILVVMLAVTSTTAWALNGLEDEGDLYPQVCAFVAYYPETVSLPGVGTIVEGGTYGVTGTATLVSPTHLVSVGYTYWPWMGPWEDLHVTCDAEPSGGAGMEVQPGEYSRMDGTMHVLEGSDVAVFVLDEPASIRPFARLPGPGVSKQALDKGKAESLSVVGYGALNYTDDWGTATGLMGTRRYMNDVSVVTVSPDTVQVDVPMGFGDDGAPLLLEGKSGKPTVLGVYSLMASLAASDWPPLPEEVDHFVFVRLDDPGLHKFLHNPEKFGFQVPDPYCPCHTCEAFEWDCCETSCSVE